LCALDNLGHLIKSNNNQSYTNALSNYFIECEKFMRYNDICKMCGGYLRVCGFACNGEITPRKFNNDTYNIHLKPYSWERGTPEQHLVDRSLRIYFKWDGTKIKIGHIGEHF
jgi:hypothetical protein